ncbi:MAG: hypothetical protein F6K31_44055 [Symploca sp. SIO2G7]|nr:hypothetical protein [Symploca sp. SIO2G7]
MKYKLTLADIFAAGILRLLGNDIYNWLIFSGNVDMSVEAMAKAVYSPTFTLEDMEEICEKRVYHNHYVVIEA